MAGSGEEPGHAGGQVYITRPGETQGTALGPLGVPLEVPPGDWVWQAEAPGAVSIGWNVIDGAITPGRGQPLRLSAKAVMACEASLPASPRARGVQALEIFAIDAGTVYNIDLAQRRRFRVPVGRFVVASEGQGGLVAVGQPQHCRAGEELVLDPPSAPGPDSFAFVGWFLRPHDTLELTSLAALVGPASARARSKAVLPQALIWMGPYGYTLFPSLPADGELELVVQHPQLRTARQLLTPVGGGALKGALLELKRRPRLVIPVDYQPAREHSRALIRGFHCGSRNQSQEYFVDRRACRAISEDLPLRPGLHDYQFEDLDEGQYLFNALVDAEEVYALGNWFAPYLSREKAEFSPVGPLLLKEHHVFGNVLKNGAAIQGRVEVALRSYADTGTRVFPTEANDLYHWYYFGYFPVSDQWLQDLPESARGVSMSRLYGMHYGFALAACGTAGGCRYFHSRSRIVGGGRLDLEIGDSSEVLVTVRDAESKKPLPGAITATRIESGEPALLFFNGELELKTYPRSLPATVLSDERGRAAFLVPPGRRSVSAAHPPRYREAHEFVEPEAGESVEVELLLPPDERAPEDLRFVFPDGSPLTRALIYATTRAGNERPDCTTHTRHDGSATLPETCRRGSLLAVLHPEALITVLEGDALVGWEEMAIRPAPARPLRLRVLDSGGAPWAGQAVTLQYGRVTLRAREFMLAYMVAGVPLALPSNSRGEIVLRGVGLEPSEAPLLALDGQQDFRPIHLGGADPGEVLEIHTD